MSPQSRGFFTFQLLFCLLAHAELAGAMVLLTMRWSDQSTRHLHIPAGLQVLLPKNTMVAIVLGGGLHHWWSKLCSAEFLKRLTLLVGPALDHHSSIEEFHLGGSSEVCGSTSFWTDPDQIHIWIRMLSHQA